MTNRLERIEACIREFNLFFVAIVLVIYSLCLCIFPVFFNEVKSLGNMLPPAFLFFLNGFDAIRHDSLLYFIVCSVYYVLSLWFIKPASNTIINLAALVVFVLILLLFSGPFYHLLGSKY